MTLPGKRAYDLPNPEPAKQIVDVLMNVGLWMVEIVAQRDLLVGGMVKVVAAVQMARAVAVK